MKDAAAPITAAVSAALDACEAAEPRLRAFVELPRELAAAEAARLDALAAAGASLGPLHGVPFCVKDIIDVAGLPTRNGSATRADAAPEPRDATVVAKLRAAGAIPAAKVHTVEHAFGGWGTNAHTGAPRNPWKPEEPHTPGGSSNGTGVAVGAGLLPAGLGTDTGGSVRIPAAFCGCVGLKTSLGLVSRAGVTPLSDSFDSVGPLTDSVARAAEMLDAMQGRDPADPATLDAPRIDACAGLEKGAAGLRLGRVSDEALSAMTTEVREGFEAALRLLEEAGARIEPFAPPRPFLAIQAEASAIISSDAYAFHSALADDPAAPLNETTRMRMLPGRDLSARDRVLAQRRRRADTADVLAAMDRLDALVLPTAPVVARPLSEADEHDYSMSLFTRFANYHDLCALSLPSGLTPGGLPLSLQIVARRFDDPLALRIGRAFERARGPFPQSPRE